MLDAAGFDDVILVPYQAYPNGHFPTCPLPNPEEDCALDKGLTLSDEMKADLLLATDPDCDRVGVAVRDGDSYRRLTGNEVGVLLFEYICRRRLKNGTMPIDAVAVKTVVTTDMARHIADAYGVELREVLTGFKYIGEQITALEENLEKKRFIFGFEENCGYLPGTYVRDKDAVAACLLICQMAQDYKSRGKTLYGALNELYKRHGYYSNTLHSFTYPGADGQAAMHRMMDSLWEEPPTLLADVPVVWEQDYLRPVPSNPGLPPADMLEYILRDASRVILRPSGTEPKVKLYIEVPASSRQEAEARSDQLAGTLKMLLKRRNPHGHTQAHPRPQRLPLGRRAFRRGLRQCAGHGARRRGLDALLPPGRPEYPGQRALRGQAPAQLHPQRGPPHPGEVYLIQPGTAHAIGGGIRLAEVQQSSNLTYRLYDYGRKDQSGQERPLHLDKALQVLNFSAGGWACGTEGWTVKKRKTPYSFLDL